jgi:hypothetical protein
LQTEQNDKQHRDCHDPSNQGLDSQALWHA